MTIQKNYQRAILFAASRHQEKNQKIPGTQLPYIVHLSNVAMEILMASEQTQGFDLNFAVQVALLHDVLEDTDTSDAQIASEFGNEVAEGVLALTKNNALPKSEQMSDSIARIRKMRKEVWAVKLADRITNLQMPPVFWKKERKISYQKEAAFLLKELSAGNDYLAKRLEGEIEKYSEYI